jgi:hypothetical protein
MSNPKFTKSKFESILNSVASGLVIGIVAALALDYFLGLPHLPLIGGIIGVIGGVVYDVLPNDSSPDEQ